MPWVPKPNKNPGKVSRVPDCWVECDGRQISGGIWEGQTTPDLNNAERFLRGGTQVKALETQEDAVQSHEHDIHDPGHKHETNYFLPNQDRIKEKFKQIHARNGVYIDDERAQNEAKSYLLDGSDEDQFYRTAFLDYHNNYRLTPTLKYTRFQRHLYDQSYAANVKTGVTVNSVKNGRSASETRPKNMKVVYIMKVC